jgi:hypothetical protein
MITESIIHGTTIPPSQHDVAGWVDHTMVEMKGEEQILKNAWMKTGYEWWPKEGSVILEDEGVAATRMMGDEEGGEEIAY